ncbi:MAG TPA: hypothetical protein DCY88_16450 [Cyanobacteria bacterium UBA11372]|nr:hypothetical protein [Cyanobacteria bacterium UBA11372]
MTLNLDKIYDEEFYIKGNPDVAKAVKEGKYKNGREHYELFGKYENRNPSICFDANQYLNENKDVWEGVQKSGGKFTAIEHYLTWGDREGRSGNRDFFNAGSYLATYGDVAKAVAKGEIGALEHALMYGAKEERQISTVYDNKFYAQTKEVQQAIASGQVNTSLEYFVTKGAGKGDIPTAIFDQDYYLERNKDVAKAIEEGKQSSAYRHFVDYGMYEKGRGFNPLFNETEYLNANQDVKEAVEKGTQKSGAEHFILYGAGEGRNPSSKFDTKFYIALNPDAKDQITGGVYSSAFEQYLAEGKQQGFIATAESFGTNKDDLILGTAIADFFDGKEGMDIIAGSGGDDILKGGAGNDFVFGDAGDDLVKGDDGNDLVFGGTGEDVVEGGAGDDIIIGEAGDDLCLGSEGNDFLYGGEANDILVGGPGKDIIAGGEGKDSLFGGDGEDLLFGGDGDDYMYGGGGKDTLVGGAGKDIFVIDTIALGSGKAGDTVTGGGAKSGFDVIYDFNASEDKLQIGGDFGFGNANDVLKSVTTGTTSTGVTYNVIALSQQFRIAVFSNSSLTVNNISVGLGNLPGSINSSTLVDIGKIKGASTGGLKKFSGKLKSGSFNPKSKGFK